MPRRIRFLITILLALAPLAAARALDWPKTEIAVTPDSGADVARARFVFKNAGQKPVHILEVRSSCGCTDAYPTTSQVAAGEDGAMVVVFTIGNRTGLQEKEITVFTDDAAKPVRLLLKVSLPDTPAAAAPGASSANKSSHGT